MSGTLPAWVERLLGIEGEAVHEWGFIVEQFYGDGVTFPLGYTDGCQMYLPTTAMLTEAGYEVDSYWEYRQPAPFAGGHEETLLQALGQFHDGGIQ